MKTCPKCGVQKPLTDFHVRRDRKDGRQPYCKECQRAAVQKHFEQNKGYYRAKQNTRNKEQRRKIKELVEAEKAKHPVCPDCDMTRPPWAMQFDHVRGTKRFNVADAPQLKWSLDQVRAEIAKCEVVCAACHAERTYERLHAPVAQLE